MARGPKTTTPESCDPGVSCFNRGWIATVEQGSVGVAVQSHDRIDGVSFGTWFANPTG